MSERQVLVIAPEGVAGIFACPSFGDRSFRKACILYTARSNFMKLQHSQTTTNYTTTDNTASIFSPATHFAAEQLSCLALLAHLILPHFPFHHFLPLTRSLLYWTASPDCAIFSDAVPATDTTPTEGRTEALPFHPHNPTKTTGPRFASLHLKHHTCAGLRPE